MQLVRNWFDKISIERIQLELMNTVYGSGHASLSRIDPRIMLIWYLFFAIVPGSFITVRCCSACLCSWSPRPFCPAPLPSSSLFYVWG